MRMVFFFFSSRRRHTRCSRDWSSDVCSSDLYVILDAGFQLSFAAVAAIFTVAPRLRRTLDGYPIPGKLADAVAVSAACGTATAPIAWLQFHAIPLLTVPANAAAELAMVPLLGLVLATAVVA